MTLVCFSTARRGWLARKSTSFWNVLQPLMSHWIWSKCDMRGCRAFSMTPVNQIGTPWSPSNKPPLSWATPHLHSPKKFHHVWLQSTLLAILDYVSHLETFVYNMTWPLKHKCQKKRCIIQCLIIRCLKRKKCTNEQINERNTQTNHRCRRWYRPQNYLGFNPPLTIHRNSL